MAALPLPPNHSAFIGPFLGWKPAFALRLAVQLAALMGPQRAGDVAYCWQTDLTDEEILERLLALSLEHAAEEAKVQESLKRKSAQRDKTEHEMT